MEDPLRDVYGDLLIVRPPVPATVNKAGANYKSEVAHPTYSPRRAYDEWLSILDAIVACGGDAIVALEPADDALLDHRTLDVDAAGTIRGDGGGVVGALADVMTGRVFAANGPWIAVRGDTLRAVMPNMLAHRRGETAYYRGLLSELAGATGLGLEIVDNPHRWEGMADVAIVGDRVVLTYAVPGHYDHATGPKTERSSRAGSAFAADFIGVAEAARIYAELVYPHFHGDTVHFGARPASGAPVLVHYPGGLYAGADAIARTLPIVPIDRDDAVEQYAGNSRQVAGGVLVPDGVSAAFVERIASLGLSTHRVPLFELFGKAGGGPACATLYLPASVARRVPRDFSRRYSVQRAEIRTRRERIPELVRVDPGYFATAPRG